MYSSLLWEAREEIAGAQREIFQICSLVTGSRLTQGRQIGYSYSRMATGISQIIAETQVKDSYRDLVRGRSCQPNLNF